MLLEALGSAARSVRRLPPRDPRQAKFVTGASLRWMWRNRAMTPWYLLRYWRLFWLRVLHPDIVTEGMVFIGRRVELYARRATHVSCWDAGCTSARRTGCARTRAR